MVSRTDADVRTVQERRDVVRMNPLHVEGDGTDMAAAVLSSDDVNEVEGGKALDKVKA